MKKIISLLASIAVLATMITSVSAASVANNAPSVDTVIEELDAASYAEMIGEELADGQAAYVVSAALSGLDLSNVRGDSTFNGKKTRTGVLLMAIGYDILWESDDNIVAIYPMDSGLAPSGGAIKSAFLATATTAGYPTTTDSAANAVTADAADINSYIVVVSGTVTGTVTGEAKVTAYEKNAAGESKSFYAADCAYTVNGEAGKVVTLTAGTIAPPAETTVELSEKIALEADGVAGAAWDVTIKNFDSAKSYMATFTNLDNGEVRRDRADEIDLSNIAETEGDVSFAVIMKLLTVTNVGLEIAIQ